MQTLADSPNAPCAIVGSRSREQGKEVEGGWPGDPRIKSGDAHDEGHEAADAETPESFRFAPCKNQNVPHIVQLVRKESRA